MHLQLEAWRAALGCADRLRLLGVDVLVSAHPDLLYIVPRERPDCWRRLRVIESVIAEVGGNGLFSVEDDAWRPQRKLVSMGTDRRQRPQTRTLRQGPAALRVRKPALEAPILGVPRA